MIGTLGFLSPWLLVALAALPLIWPILRLTPPRPITLETALEFIAADELVEVTPLSIRLRKRSLSQHDRRRQAGRADDERRSLEREAASAG